MADPAIIACAADVWTKVATNKTSGAVHVFKGTGLTWYQTYRDTGGAAPTDLTDSIKLIKPTDPIDSSIGIDVYVQPVSGAGSVRVDLI